MYLTDEVKQEHDKLIAGSLSHEWDITTAVFLDGRQFNVSLSIIRDLLESKCIVPIVTGSTEYRIALIRAFVKEGIRVPVNGCLELVTPATFQAWLEAKVHKDM